MSTGLGQQKHFNMALTTFMSKCLYKHGFVDALGHPSNR